MKILTNFPLEIFGAREEYPFDEILSFGPAQGRREGDRVYPFDIQFEAGHGSLGQLFSLLPEGFHPDCLLFWWPDQEPLPRDLECCLVPVVGVMSDYNLSLPYLTRIWPFFDLLLCDRPGLQVLGRFPFAKVEPFCQYSFRPDVHRVYTDKAGKPIERDIDICFAGNMSPIVQKSRAPWIDKIRALDQRYRVFTNSVQIGEPYGRLLSRSKIVFNRSVRGEINLRAFEATSAGALLFMERENEEIRDYFEDGRECVLYGPDDLEKKLVYYLEHDTERERIANAGRERVQEYRMARHCAKLPKLIAEIDLRDRAKADDLTLLLGRGTAMTGNVRQFPEMLEPLRQARERFPQSPVAANNLAVSLWGRFPEVERPNVWLELLVEAAQASPGYLPARLNLLRMYQQADMQSQAVWVKDEIKGLLGQELSMQSFDGLLMPLGYSLTTISFAASLTEALRRNETEPLRQWYLAALDSVGDVSRSPLSRKAQASLDFSAC